MGRKIIIRQNFPIWEIEEFDFTSQEKGDLSFKSNSAAGIIDQHHNVIMSCRQLGNTERFCGTKKWPNCSARSRFGWPWR